MRLLIFNHQKIEREPKLPAIPTMEITLVPTYSTITQTPLDIFELNTLDLNYQLLQTLTICYV